MLFVTLHGGKPGAHPHKNNVHAYDKDGKLVTPSVLQDSDNVVLDELRGIGLFGKLLYVVNANNTQNSLLCYEGSDTNYKFVSKFVSQQTCNGVVHPFDFAFDGAGHCYLSSQDTNLVTRFAVSADGKIGNPAPLAPALPHGNFPPGTFVASSVGNLCGLQTTAVPAPLGLQYSDDGQKKHSVRGIVWANNALYVVDQVAGTVKVYDSNGNLLGQSNQVETPVHLNLHNGNLFVTGANSVLTAKVTQPAGNFNLSALPGLHIKNAGGMAFGNEGNVYVASRTEKLIQKLDPKFQPLTPAFPMPDDPEFLFHI